MGSCSLGDFIKEDLVRVSRKSALRVKVKVKFKVKFKVEIALKEESASEEGWNTQKEEVIFQNILFEEEIIVQRSEVFGFVIKSFQGRVKGA